MSDNQRDNIVDMRGRKLGEEALEKTRNKKRKSSGLKPEHLGVIIFFVIFAYVVINLYVFYAKNKVSIYEVQPETLAMDRSFDAIAIREETLYSSNASGYINYYTSDSTRVSNGMLVYTVDEGSSIYSTLSETSGKLALGEKEISSIKKIIHSYKKNYKNEAFSTVSAFSDQLNTEITTLIYERLLNDMESISTADYSSAFNKSYASQAGVISYESDTLCNISSKDVNGELFRNIDEYSMKSLRSTGLVAAGDPVYRLCTSENWSLVVNVNEQFYVNMLDKQTATVYVNGEKIKLKGTLTPRQLDNDYFLVIDLDSYMVRYLNDRFVKVEFDLEEEEGYKIPLSSITKKAFYLIPSEYLLSGENASGKYLAVERFNTETGKTELEYYSPSTYYSDGYYIYIDTDELEEGIYLVNPENGDRTKTGLVNYLEGVYNVNKGYYVFKRIERLRENNEYCIIKKGTKGGVTIYDHIALDAETALESALIY